MKSNESSPIGLPRSLTELPGQVLFEATGTFNKKKAMEKLSRASAVFLLALQDAGQIEDSADSVRTWAQGVGIPEKGFASILDAMLAHGWVARIQRADGGYFWIVAPAGITRADALRELIGQEEGPK